ncbi:Protein YcgL [Vibrio stylophorae]|uniref:YcgL domain-containing protein VST7929_01168 n=1 Tax=Vibrio stylophorae TaxID=659351 RepID=A0ABN8DQ62_9VIBR|nr:YcgL domain-containing protein [Vibrio stylophorae]CAH0533304.1 Protein YcgL [Vibrio stylophorae]
MWCAIYRSPKKMATYLYIERKDDFSSVPEALLQTFGTPEFVMVLKLTPERRLANANIDHVRDALTENGFYLQLPPTPENLLAAERALQNKE